jgi:hypothetical protein
LLRASPDYYTDRGAGEGSARTAEISAGRSKND